MMYNAIQYRRNDNGVLVPVAIVEVIQNSQDEDIADIDFIPIDNPEALRQMAYVAEADVFRDRAISYEEEAKALREANNDDAAIAAENKARDARYEYLRKKEEIRTLYPDD